MNDEVKPLPTRADKTRQLYKEYFGSDYNESIYRKLLTEINEVAKKGERILFPRDYTESQLIAMSFKLIEDGYEVDDDKSNGTFMIKW